MRKLIPYIGSEASQEIEPCAAGNKYYTKKMRWYTKFVTENNRSHFCLSHFWNYSHSIMFYNCSQWNEYLSVLLLYQLSYVYFVSHKKDEFISCWKWQFCLWSIAQLVFCYSRACFKITVKCGYNAVKILHSALGWQWQNISQTLN